MKQEAARYAARYGYNDLGHTLNEIELREQITDCEDNKRALTTAYSRAKRQLTKCGYGDTTALFQSLKQEVKP